MVAEFFGEFIENVKDVGVWEALKKAVASVWEGLKDIISEAWEGISNDVDGKINDIVTGAKAAWEEMKAAAAVVFREVTDTIINALENLGETIGDIFGDEAELAWNDFIDFLREIPIIIEAVASEISRLMPSINEIVDGMVQAVNIMKDLKGMVEEIAAEGFWKTAFTGADPVNAETNPELFAPISAEEIEDARRAIQGASAATKELTKDMQAATETQATFGDEGVYNSVWPDTNEWVGKNAETIRGLSSEITQAGKAQEAFGASASRSLAGVGDQWDAINRKMTALQQTTTIADARRPQQQQQTVATQANTTGTAEPPKTTTSGIAQPVSTVINISGVASVDESSKERLARMITGLQSGLRSQAITAA
jgi:cell division protein ZapA (FtsZ GTPase activity inhibitor)